MVIFAAIVTGIITMALGRLYTPEVVLSALGAALLGVLGFIGVHAAEYATLAASKAMSPLPPEPFLASVGIGLLLLITATLVIAVKSVDGRVKKLREGDSDAALAAARLEGREQVFDELRRLGFVVMTQGGVLLSVQAKK